MNEYSYKELKEAAMRRNARAEDRIALVEWFEWFSNGRDWNGEFWDLGNGLRLYPIYEGREPDEDGEYTYFELVDAEIR